MKCDGHSRWAAICVRLRVLAMGCAIMFVATAASLGGANDVMPAGGGYRRGLWTRGGGFFGDVASALGPAAAMIPGGEIMARAAGGVMDKITGATSGPGPTDEGRSDDSSAGSTSTSDTAQPEDNGKAVVARDRVGTIVTQQITQADSHIKTVRGSFNRRVDDISRLDDKIASLQKARGEACLEKGNLEALLEKLEKDKVAWYSPLVG
ncbi:hypothetical protein JKP88DRAFT_19106 [Tribonema minus]|uniref:Uncharacterized protein n=1 Tax=Tribonema minus TaxID=303371 RepID=A0A835YTB7_9STRA|nr:hypothetical protein JKP88DRAFT_93713 [Tribonema minus]KAG5189866.1 hypothetical protein JKP88DRAFT_19106 [Tribonema minus]